MTQWKAAFLKTGNDFLENTTLNGYRYLVEPGRHWAEKTMWFIVNVLATWGVVYFVLYTWFDFTAKPTITTIESTQHPIWEVEFPGIAICPVNKISLRRAKEYAEKLSEKDSQFSKNELLRNIQYMGRIYDLDVEGQEDFTRFQDWLDIHDSNATTGLFEIGKVMTELQPDCEEILVRCEWEGRIRNCTELFEFRQTMEGNCCTFNYIRKRDVQSLKADSPGSALGLIAVIYPDINDYFYPLYNTEGFNVHVFNPRDFPDTPSGGLLEKIISLRTEMFLRIDASTVHSVPDVGHFSVKQRGCIFNNDNTKIMYSFSDCLTLCRIRSIRALCGCKIFYYPKDDDLSATEDADVPPCTLQHIPCLNKYKVKWRTQKPTEGNLEGLEHELEDSISCPHCIPACSSTSYFAQSTWAPIMRNEFQQSNFLGGLELTNHSILRVYFGTSNTLLYRKDVLYYWYEIISNFGGIGGLFVGFSLMSLVEFVYYFTVEFYQNLRHTSESAVMKTPIKLSRRIKEDVFIKTDYDEIVLSKQLFRNKNKMYKNNFNTRYFE